MTKQKHIFDVRSQFAIREIKRAIKKHGKSERTVTCLRCKKQVNDPSASCSAPLRASEMIVPSGRKGVHE